MSRWSRFNNQFRETAAERRARLRTSYTSRRTDMNAPQGEPHEPATLQGGPTLRDHVQGFIFRQMDKTMENADRAYHAADEILNAVELACPKCAAVLADRNDLAVAAKRFLNGCDAGHVTVEIDLRLREALLDRPMPSEEAVQRARPTYEMVQAALKALEEFWPDLRRTEARTHPPTDSEVEAALIAAFANSLSASNPLKAD